MLDVTTHRVQLDNTGPVVDVQITGIGGNCGKFAPGTPVLGTFVARDLYLGSWSLATSPQPPAPVVASAPSPTGGSSQTPLAPGLPWTLVTTGMTACGYTITVTAVDRAIVDSASVGHWELVRAGVLRDLADGSDGRGGGRPPSRPAQNRGDATHCSSSVTAAVSCATSRVNGWAGSTPSSTRAGGRWSSASKT